jgi:uncharacterized protein YndB with AHSA1/START domain
MNTKTEPHDGQPARMEIVSTRSFAHPRESVFNAFADPAQLAQWWGPNGFTNTISRFELRPGGVWRFVMHGPDGAGYENTSEFVEIVRPERIVFDHLMPMHRFRMTMTFEDKHGATNLTWRMQFEPDEQNETLRPLIVHGNEENFDRLAAHLQKTRR